MSDGTFWGELKRRNVIRVATVYAVGGFVVLQLADILFPALSLAEQDIRYVVAALLLLFPVVVAFSWFYELTPDGLRRTTAVEEDASITSDTGRRIDRIVIVLLSLAVIALLARMVIVDGGASEAPSQADAEPSAPTSTPPAARDPAIPSVAVLPLVNMSSDTENEHFADGLTEELLNRLAQNDNLRVAARTSSFFYKGRNEDLRTVGEALGVEHLLEGSVRKAGDRIRITVQLIKADDGFHLWSQTFDREVLDVFAVQDEISVAVARAMEVALVPEDPRIANARSTADARAYDLYLRASEALASRTREGVSFALEAFAEAAELDPGYGPPLLGRAEAALVAQNNFGTLELLEAEAIADEALDRADAIGFTEDRYWALRGLQAQHLMLLDASRYDAAVEAFERSLAINENRALTYTWYASTLEDRPGTLSASERTLRDQRIRQLLEQSLRLDPLNRVTQTNYLRSIWAEGDDDRYWEMAEEFRSRDPEYAGFHYQIAWNLLTIGRFDDSLATFFDAPGGPPNAWPLIVSLVALNERERVLDVAERIPRDAPEYDSVQLRIFAETATTEDVLDRARSMLESTERALRSQGMFDRLLREEAFTVARELLERAFPTLTEETPQTNAENLLAFYARILYLEGQRERAQELATLVLAQNEGTRVLGPGGRGVENLWSYLVLERREDAVAELETLFEAGWRNYYAENMHESPFFDPIRDDPRTIAVRSAVDADLAEQKPRCLQLLADNGYL